MDINGMMDVLLADLMEELGDTSNFCATTLYPGEQAPFDYGACGGVVWVRLVSANPSASFPTPVASIDVCSADLAFPLEVGVVRPAPMLTTRTGEAILPKDSENTDAAHKQNDDMKAMYRAIQRLRAYTELLLVGSYTPLGGSTAEVVGGTWSLTVGEDDL
jgi:hypothetical protein